MEKSFWMTDWFAGLAISLPLPLLACIPTALPRDGARADLVEIVPALLPIQPLSPLMALSVLEGGA